MAGPADSSYIMAGTSPTDEDDMDSLPSSETTDSEEENEADREWRESLQQLELLLTMVVVPYLGKYFGRKCAYLGMLRSFHSYRIYNRMLAISSYLQETNHDTSNASLC